MLQLSLLLDTQDELGVFVLSDRMLNLSDSDTRDVNIPAVDVVALGQGMHNTSVDGIAVHNFNLGKPNTLFES